MKRFLSFLPVLLLISHGCNCGDELEVTFSCPPVQECFLAKWDENKEENIITGKSLEYYKVCHFGHTVCDPDTKEITCEDIGYPQKEICDGIDNDCNGQIDDGEHLFVPKYHRQNPCEETEVGVCKNSDAQCILGEWFCIPPADLFGNEVCDGRDNDCDGEIDEDIEETFVYTGPPETLNVGECRAGLQKCEGGRFQNFGMVTPIDEICGNDDDDDCDGLTDELEESPESYDFALILDVSGSMSQYLYSLNITLCDWANTTRFQNSRFAIIGLAMNPHEGHEYGIGVITDFVDSTQACQELNNFLAFPGTTSIYEYQMDAILKSMTIGDNIELSWSHREKRIVMFSDEQPQWISESDQYGNLYVTLENIIEQIINACTTTNTTVSIFTPWGVVWNSVWDDIVSYCGGYLEYLVQNPQEMIERLNYWFGEEC